VTKTKSILVAALVVLLCGCQQPSVAGPQPPAAPLSQAASATATNAAPPSPKAGVYRVLFDASHAETAGNADWLVSTSMPDPLAEYPDPRHETDWTGALSAWGVALQQTGRYQITTLPRGSRITYGAGGSLDLANFDVFVVPEPNTRFANAEQTAIVTFVQRGGGLFMIADHDGSDRNKDGIDSPRIWNDLMSGNGVAANPFGFRFDLKDVGRDDPQNIPADAAGDPVIRGPFGVVKGSIIRDGTTATLDPRANPSVRGLLYRTGADPGGTSGVFFLTSTFGQGRVAAWGDSSPIDDGTGASHEQLFDGWNDAGGSDAILALNATEWLAQGEPSGATPAAVSTAPAAAAQDGGGQLVQNGDFERELASWQARGGARASDERAHGGRLAAQLCGTNNCQASLAQQVDLPAGAQAIVLSFSVFISTEETRHAYDFLTIELREPGGKAIKTLRRLSDGDAADDWAQQRFDLSAYAGRPVVLAFTATSGKLAPTAFFVDDVRIVVQ
jgi:hypothetical protein